ncbi:hypothetical protein V500_04562 [Pseudogymnoascus sp. VKM F-4518 (FW-2643)]|nr:hypothetical protein V500_04562 [Pseudogymnoascus sp. VKM F-4518 (FW-2643)]
MDRRMSVISTFSSLLEPVNTPDQSKLNVAKHYDLSNNIFAAFLSPDMTYSCPLWLPPQDPDHSIDTLEKAQERKYDYHIKAARIQSTDHVLEIGTGWGSFAIQAVRDTGCTVTSITPSKEQKALAEERIAAACLTDKITIVLCDYREVPQLGIQYDRLVSIEMIEHIGLQYLEGYFSIIDKLLKKTGGVASFQCTLMAESFQEENQTSDSFIRKYIFAGGFLPNLTQMVGAINKGTNHSLIIDRIENLGGYGRALSEWTDTFKVNFDSLIRPEVIRKNPNISDTEIEAFRRKWLYYFAYCQAGFDAQVLRSVTIRLRREGTPALAQDYYA